MAETAQCTCPRSMQPLGRWDGINMGQAMLRTSTTKDCPVHDSCQHYTKAVRAERPWWSNPYCPIHKTRDCPDA